MLAPGPRESAHCARSPGSWRPVSPWIMTSCRALRGTRRSSMSCMSKALPNNIPACLRTWALMPVSLRPQPSNICASWGDRGPSCSPPSITTSTSGSCSAPGANFTGATTRWDFSHPIRATPQSGRKVPCGGVSGHGTAAARRVTEVILDVVYNHTSAEGDESRPHAIAQRNLLITHPITGCARPRIALRRFSPAREFAQMSHIRARSSSPRIRCATPITTSLLSDDLRLADKPQVLF